MEKTLHMILGNALFLIAVLNMILALSLARSDAAMSKLMKWSHSLGLLWVGRLVLLIGIGRVISESGYYLSSVANFTWQGWVAILLWAPVEIVGKRHVVPDLAVVQDGGQASSRLGLGAGIQLVMITAIIGLMHSIPST